jgi:hypothetical protein
MWWQPILCAPLMLCTRGLSREVVENILIAEEPAPARIWVGVTAMENMSPAHAIWCQQLLMEGQFSTVIDRFRGEVLLRLERVITSFGFGRGVYPYHFHQSPPRFSRLRMGEGVS